MAAKFRRVWITIGIVLLVIVAAAIAVRLVLTKQKLMAIVVPRVERMVNARVAIEDIGIDFPFGFGVTISGLRFEKSLPDTTDFVFASDRVTVRASLASLIRRRPEITSASIERGAVRLLNAKRFREVNVRGLEARLSMKPVSADTFAVSVRSRIDTVTVSRPGAPPAAAFEKVGFEGDLAGDRALTTLIIRNSRVTWEELLSATVAGEVTEIKTAPRLSVTIVADAKPLAPLLAKVKTFRLGELSPTPKSASPPSPQPPAEITGGTAGFNARLEGLAREPLGMEITFEAVLEGASIKMGNLVSIGRLDANVKGAGNALAWQSLMPSGEKPLTLEQMTLSWQAIDLEGTLKVADGSFELQRTGATAAEPAPPLRITGLSAEADIAGTDVKKLSGAFSSGGSPYTFAGSLRNIMPAAGELAIVARQLRNAGTKKVADLGPYLDRMVNAPAIDIELSGRSFDARPYQPAEGAPRPDQGAAVPAQTPAPSATGGGAGGILFLKNTTFTAKLDSVVTRQAVLTGVEAKGAIRDGRLRVEPLTFGYAGGKGTAILKTDLRTPARVTSAVDFSIDGVEAGQALGRLASIGSLIQGRFAVKSNANLVTGAGLNPLLTLTASGSALSTRGSVDFERYVRPLSTIQNFDITPFKSFDFSDWAGTFTVRDGRFLTDDWKIASSSGAWDIKGSFGFDGSIDYRVHVVVPPDVQSRMKNIESYKSALDLMRDASGNLVLDIKVNGTAKNPSASLDLAKAKSKMQDRLMEGLKKKLIR